MAAQIIDNPLFLLNGLNGQALTGGYVYLGEPDLDPTTSPKAVYWDEDMTIPAQQPLRTNAGYITRNGAPARVWTDGNYSILVKDAQGRQIFYIPFWSYASAGNVTYLQDGVGAVLRSLQARLRDTVSVKDFDVEGDGVTDDSANIQKAIDAVHARGGGTVYFPIGTYKALGLVLKEGVTLLGQQGNYGYLPSNVSRATLLAAGAGTMISTPGTRILSPGVVGINFKGLGAATACVGINFGQVTYGCIKQCQFDNFADQAFITQSTAIACVLEDIMITNAVLNRARAAVIGACDIGGTDHHVNRVEATASVTSLSSASAYIAAINFSAINCDVIASIGEISDVGWHVSGSLNKFSSNRADLNRAHGWRIVGGGNQFSACAGLTNGQETANTYDNWHATSASANNLFVGCYAGTLSGNAPRYGFYDDVTATANKNRYMNVLSTGATTGQYRSNSSNGSCFDFPTGPALLLTVNSATPSVLGYKNFFTTNTLATVYTDFTDAVPGQEITILCADSNSTLQHNGATISLPYNQNIAMVNGQIYTLVKVGSVWRLKSGTFGVLQASTTYDPPNLVDGAGVTTTIVVAGAAMGDFVIASFSNDLQGIIVTAYVYLSGNIAVRFQNETGGAIDLASGTLSVRVFKA